MSPYCPACGAPMTEESVKREENLAANYMNAALMGMKWYKFLTFFSLPLSLVINAVTLLNSIKLLQGFDPGQYKPEYVEPLLLSLRVGLVMVIIMMLLIGVAEWGLVKRKKLGVRALIGMYGVQLVNGVFNAVLLGRMGLLDFSTVTGIATAVMMLCLNIVYFRKRKALFE